MLWGAGMGEEGFQLAGWSCFSLWLVSSRKAGTLCDLSLHFLVQSLQLGTQVPTSTWHWIEFSFSIGCGASQSDRVLFSSDISKCGTNYCFSAQKSFQPNRVSWGLNGEKKGSVGTWGFLSGAPFQLILVSKSFPAQGYASW